MVTIRFFAAVREAAGGLERDEQPPSAGLTVGRVLDEVAEKWPALRPLRGYLRAAVNQELARDGDPVADGDEVAVFPPMAGGSAGLVALVSMPFAIDAVVESVRGPTTGGLVVFLGLVRDTNDGRAVETLEYEAYREMAEKELRAAVASVAAEHPRATVGVVHRIGLLRVGDVAVCVAAGAEHRDSAFAAARALIDRVKERVPIWKKETGPGGVHWVGLPPKG